MTGTAGAGRMDRENAMTSEQFSELMAEVPEWRAEVAFAAEDAPEAKAEVLAAADDDLSCAECSERESDLVANLQAAAERLATVRGTKRVAREIRDALTDAGVAS